MRRYLDLIRYNYFISRIILLSVMPFMWIDTFAFWLKKRVKINGGSIHYYGAQLDFPKDVGIGVLSKIYWMGEAGFEQYFGQYLTIALKKSEIFLDVGSNFGFYSVLACKTNPHIFSYCFEPVDFLRIDNKRFHDKNNTDRYQLIDKAVGDEDGIAQIMIPDQKELKFLITSATLSKSFADAKKFKVIQKEIQVVKLDTFFRGLIDSGKATKDSKVVIKIDVEGFEMAVLTGAVEMLTKLKPVIFVEVFLSEANVSTLNTLLVEVGYKLYALSNIGLVKMNLSARYHGDRNFVLLPQSIFNGSFISATDFEAALFSA